MAGPSAAEAQPPIGLKYGNSVFGVAVESLLGDRRVSSLVLGGANAIQELFDFVLEVNADLGQRLGRFQHLARRGSGLRGARCDAFDVVGDVERAAGGGLDALRDALGGVALLLHGGGNRRGDGADALNGGSDRLDRVDVFAGGALHVDDVRADLV